MKADIDRGGFALTLIPESEAERLAIDTWLRGAEIELAPQECGGKKPVRAIEKDRIIVS